MKKNASSLDPTGVPAHVAIIMDGNGRWAKQRSLSRSEGHRKGAEAIEPLMDAAVSVGVKAVSLFAFSSENWVRPQKEILGLWKLLDYFFDTRMEALHEKGIRIIHSGSLKRLPPGSKKKLGNAIEKTKNNKTGILNLCINYGSRQEVVGAVNCWLDERRGSEKLTMKRLEKHLFTADLPEVDLLIRTSGEYRISNFLLYQLAYAELLFTDVLWPDFSPEDFYGALYEYQQRERRYGGI